MEKDRFSASVQVLRGACAEHALLNPVMVPSWVSSVEKGLHNRYEDELAAARAAKSSTSCPVILYVFDPLLGVKESVMEDAIANLVKRGAQTQGAAFRDAARGGHKQPILTFARSLQAAFTCLAQAQMQSIAISRMFLVLPSSLTRLDVSHRDETLRSLSHLYEIAPGIGSSLGVFVTKADKAAVAKARPDFPRFLQSVAPDWAYRRFSLLILSDVVFTPFVRDIVVPNTKQQWAN
jgi:hypothetical protein